MGGAITFNLSTAANLSALRARRFLITARSRVASRRVAEVVAFFRRIRFAELYGLGIVLSNLLVDIEARTVTALAPKIRGRSVPSRGRHDGSHHGRHGHECQVDVAEGDPSRGVSPPQALAFFLKGT
jgi:hypothetical protein